MTRNRLKITYSILSKFFTIILICLLLLFTLFINAQKVYMVSNLKCNHSNEFSMYENI